jgi:adenylate cyclase
MALAAHGFARLTEALKSYKAAVVGFDMVFSEPDETELKRAGGPENFAGPADKVPPSALGNDETFARSIRAHGNTIIGYPLEMNSDDDDGRITPGFVTKVAAPAPLAYSHVQVPEQGPSPPLPEAVAYLRNLPAISSAARGTGYFDAPSDPDGVFRSEMMVIRFGQAYREPLVLAVISAYANGAPTSLALTGSGVDRVGVGPLSIPVDEQGRMLVNFRGPARTFPYYSVSDVIAHRIAVTALANKIVLVGTSALGVGDRRSTPMGAEFPGVEIHANAIDNILTGDFIQRSEVTAGMAVLAAVMMGLAVSAAVAYLSASWSLIAAAAMMCGYFAIAQYLLVTDGLLVGVLFPIITAFITYAGTITYRYISGERENRILRHAVGERG